ncbi:hypothetical protein GCM10028791_11040 [Echinicola sediminis]
MIRTLPTLLLLLAFAFGAKAQTTDGINEAAHEFALANLNEDYETLIKHTYPFILEKSGGKEAFQKALEDSYDLLKIRGMKIKSFEIGNPIKATHCSDEVHALVPVTSILSVPNGEIVSHITLIAVSKDSSDEWYFIEASNLEPKTIHNYLPTWDYTLGLTFENTKEFVAKKFE